MTTSNPNLVLVVDDERTIREYIAAALRDGGHKTIEAATAADALWLATEHRPVAVLTDLHLGAGPSGADLARALRAGVRGAPRRDDSGRVVPAPG